PEDGPGRQPRRAAGVGASEAARRFPLGFAAADGGGADAAAQRVSHVQAQCPAQRRHAVTERAERRTWLLLRRSRLHRAADYAAELQLPLMRGGERAPKA